MKFERKIYRPLWYTQVFKIQKEDTRFIYSNVDLPGALDLDSATQVTENLDRYTYVPLSSASGHNKDETYGKKNLYDTHVTIACLIFSDQV